MNPKSFSGDHEEHTDVAEMDAKAGDMDTDVGCMYGANTDCDTDMAAADLNRPEPIRD